MAFRCRIRHKLLLGLGLVVSIIALLLSGTIYGLAKFRSTMKIIDSKQSELLAAEPLRDEVKKLQNPEVNLPDQIAKIGEALKDYKNRLRETLERGRDPEKGFNEQEQVDGLHAQLTLLKDLSSKKKGTAGPYTGPLSEEGAEIVKSLIRTSGDLCSVLYTRLGKQSREARRTFTISMWIVCPIGVGGVLLLCGLLRTFYRWVFYPIRDLEQGAGRVAQGDFEHRIEVHSGDEMEDLAAAFNDMTSRLREMYRDLAHQVNERSRQLVRSERLAGVGFLAAGVSHEINNPLASIAFCSEALEGRLAEVLLKNPEIRDVVTKYLKMIQQEAFRCKAITQRLLEFSRGGERSREPADLVEITQAVLDMVQHLQNVKGKQVVFQPAGKLTAWVNAQEIKSVVLNLVVNALDSMEEGGTLRIAVGKRDGMAEMTFTDSGCGMTPEVLENIFEPFFTRSRTGKGTGLGLSISHRVISQHGGEIEATSPGLNRGSTFTVRLPLQPAVPVKEESIGRLAA